MRFSRTLRSRAHEGNRVQVDAKTFFRQNDAIRAQYDAALAAGSRLVVFLEGDVGHGKGDVLWRVASQGYATAQLPFVPWLERRGFSSLQDPADVLQASREWQIDFDRLVRDAVGSTSGRPGLLFAARSPLTSALELERRGLAPAAASRAVQLPSYAHVVLALVADPLVVERRVAEKVFNEPQSRASLLRNRLRELVRPAHDVSFRSDGAINTTSTKQGTAALLALVGIAPPVFPPRT